MIMCPLAGLPKTAYKSFNYDKLKKISQGLDENLAFFLSCLREALQKFTSLDLASQEGLLLLNMHFISQSDIRNKLQKLEEGPETSKKDLLNIAFKVFNNRD